EGLARVRAGRPVDPEQRRRILQLEKERDRAWDEYDRLREEYLEVERSARAPPPPALAFIDRLRIESPLAHLLRKSYCERLASRDADRTVAERGFLRVVVGPVDKTLASLATADHRTLTHPRVAELRRHIARLDAVVARLQEAPAARQSGGWHEVGALLQRMGYLATAPAVARRVEPFRKLLDERRIKIAGIAGAALPAAPAELPGARSALHRLLPSVGEEHLHRLRRLHPGVEKLLRQLPESAIVAVARRADHLTPLERIQRVLPQLRAEPALREHDRAYGFARVDTREQRLRLQQPHVPTAPLEPLSIVPSAHEHVREHEHLHVRDHELEHEDEHVEQPRAVPPLVAPPAKKEAEPELVAPVPPFPPPEPEAEETPAVAKAPEPAHLPRHALAKIARLRAIAARLRQERHHDERPGPPAERFVAAPHDQPEHELTLPQKLSLARERETKREQIAESAPGPVQAIVPPVPLPGAAPQILPPKLPLEMLLHEAFQLPHLGTDKEDYAADDLLRGEVPAAFEQAI
ncbi:MAG TPA: hypothetical protein VG496_06780, partial [Myxococcales bacterium]|nr:hypothetical protein [Myxococcales bacterium]